MQMKGVYVPVVTPFDADENIDYKVLQQLIDFVLANGVVGLVPGGTTGEVYAFSESERLDIFKFYKDYAGNRATLLAGTNSGATRDVVRYSEIAAKMGYDGLMVAVPPYSRPNQRELLAHYRAVANAVEIPIVLYNFPWRAGSEIGYDVLDGLVDCKNVIGIKESSGEMPRLYEMRMRYGERYQIVCGSDDEALDYFLWGTQAWIGGAGSCAPSQHVAVLEAAQAGDFIKARTAMEKILPLLRNMESGSYTQKAKYGCELLGMPVGNPRRPLLPLLDEDKREIERVFAIAQG